MALTPDQLQAIHQHLKDTWLNESAFIDEIFDHYTLAIEDKISQGQEFDVAMHQVYKDFGRRIGLLEMEQKYKESVRNNVWVAWSNAFKNRRVILGALFVSSIFLFIYYRFPNLQTDAEMAEIYAGSIMSVGCVLVLYSYIATLYYSRRRTVARQSCFLLINYCALPIPLVSGFTGLGLMQQLYLEHSMLFFLSMTAIFSSFIAADVAWRNTALRYKFFQKTA